MLARKNANRKHLHHIPEIARVSRRSAVDKKKRTGNLSPLMRCRSSSGPKKIIGAFSHEGERSVQANGLIRVQELSGNSAPIGIVPCGQSGISAAMAA